MEYLHASLLLHSAGKKITAKAITDILTAAGLKPDTSKIKGLVASLAGVNIEEALKSATAMPAVAPAAPAVAAKSKKAAPAAAAKAEEKEEEEEEAGLSSLFG